MINPLRIDRTAATARTRASTLKVLCAILAVGSIAVMLLLPARRVASEASRRMQCANNLRQIGLAMMDYHQIYHSFPPAYTVDSQGNRLHSWRTLLLPFLEQAHLASLIDMTKPWNDPSNQRAIREKIGDTPPAPYRCSSHKSERNTAYVVVVDPESCFIGSEPVSMDQLSDGAANTLLVIEAAEGQTVEWMSPHDTDWNTLANLNENTRFAHPNIFNVLFADGTVRPLHSGLTLETRRSFVTIAAGDQARTNDTDWEQ